MENRESHGILTFISFSRPGNSWKTKVMYGSLVSADAKARTKHDTDDYSQDETAQREPHALGWTPEFVSVELS